MANDAAHPATRHLKDRCDLLRCGELPIWRLPLRRLQYDDGVVSRVPAGRIETYVSARDPIMQQFDAIADATRAADFDILSRQCHETLHIVIVEGGVPIEDNLNFWRDHTARTAALVHEREPEVAPWRKRRRSASRAA